MRRFLQDPSLASIGNVSRLKMEKEKTERLLKEISRNGNVTYGYDNVLETMNTGAIEEIMITETEFRNERTIKLLEKASSYGIKVTIFSDETEYGKIVQGLGGICAFLNSVSVMMISSIAPVFIVSKTLS